MLNLISKPVSFLSLKSLGFLLHMHHQRCYKVLALATIFENITQVKLMISNSVLFEFDRKRNKKKQFKLENYPIRNEMVFLKKK